MGMIDELKFHLENTSLDELKKEWKEVEAYANIGPTVDDFLEKIIDKYKEVERREAK